MIIEYLNISCALHVQIMYDQATRFNGEFLSGDDELDNTKVSVVPFILHFSNVPVSAV